MAKFNGTEFKAKIVGTPNRNIVNSRDLTIKFSIAPIETSDKESQGWAEYIGGKRSWTGSLTGIVDFVPGTNNVNVAELYALGIARALVDLTFGNAITGNTSFAGKALITDVSFGTPYEGACEWTAELQGSGPIALAPIA